MVLEGPFDGKKKLSCFYQSMFINPCFINPYFINPCYINPRLLIHCFINPHFINPRFIKSWFLIHVLLPQVLPFQSSPCFIKVPFSSSLFENFLPRENELSLAHSLFFYWTEALEGRVITYSQLRT